MRNWPLDRPLLIVDRDHELATLWQIAISRRGGECRVARSFREAFHAVAGDARPWMLLVDHSIIRAVPKRMLDDLRELAPDVTVIGTGGDGARRAFAVVGIDDFVHKPWGSPEHLGGLLLELTQTTDSIELGLLALDHALHAFAGATA